MQLPRARARGAASAAARAHARAERRAERIRPRRSRGSSFINARAKASMDAPANERDSIRVSPVPSGRRVVRFLSLSPSLFLPTLLAASFFSLRESRRRGLLPSFSRAPFRSVPPLISPPLSSRRARRARKTTLFSFAPRPRRATITAPGDFPESAQVRPSRFLFSRPSSKRPRL